MTSQELVDKIHNYRFFRQSKSLFNSDEIYMYANDAQKEILTDFRAVEGSCSLSLVSGQEEYSFNELAITNASNTSPIVITTDVSHNYNDGDSIINNSVGGNTAANGLHTVKKLTSTTFELVGSVGSGAYTSGGKSYHALMQAFETYQVRKTGQYYGRLDKKEMFEIDEARADYGISSSVEKVNRYYESYQNQYVFGVQGIPSSSIILQLRFYRIPLSFQEISETTNPILGTIYDRCLFLGAAAYLIESMEANEHQQIAYKETMTLFNNEKMRLRSVIAEQRIPRPQQRYKIRM